MIINKNITNFTNKNVLIEMTDGVCFGTLGTFKDKLAIYEGNYVKNIIIPENIISILCENTKTIVKKIDKPKEKRKHDHTIVDNSDGELIHENFKVLLRDRLKSRFFGDIAEEVVNPENEFTMTEPEILKRDHMADAMLNSPNFKPKLKGKDTKENAAHRIATFQIMRHARNKHGYEPSLFTHGRDDSAPKRTRKEKLNQARMTMRDKAQDKYDKKLLKSTQKKIPNTNRTTGLSGSSKNVPKNRKEAEKQKASRKSVTSRKTFANAKGSAKLTMAAHRKNRLAKNLKTSPYASK